MAEIVGRYSKSAQRLAQLSQQVAARVSAAQSNPAQFQPAQWRRHSLVSRVDPETIALMGERYSAGISAPGVAREFGVSPSMVYSALKHSNTPVRPAKQLNEAQVELLQLLLAQGLSHREIGERVGVTRQAVGQRCGQLGS